MYVRTETSQIIHSVPGPASEQGPVCVGSVRVSRRHGDAPSEGDWSLLCCVGAALSCLLLCYVALCFAGAVLCYAVSVRCCAVLSFAASLLSLPSSHALQCFPLFVSHCTALHCSSLGAPDVTIYHATLSTPTYCCRLM